MEATITSYIELVLQREPVPGEVETWVTLIETGQTDIDGVRQSIIDSQEAVNDVYPVILAYQAIYGRVPDAEGLDYWVNVYRGVQDLDNPETPTQNEALVAVLEAFVNPALTPGFVERYGENPTAAQFVVASYTNVLNRAPDQEGQNYWTNRYNEVRAELEAANPEWSADELNVQTRAIILEQFVSSDEFAAATGTAIDNYLDAVAQGQDGAYDGSLWNFDDSILSFALTTGADNLVGNDNDNVFTADLALIAEGAIGIQTLQGQDTIDGGGGFNSLYAELAGSGTTQNPTLTNIQALYLTAFGDSRLDLARAEGVEEVHHINTRDADLFVDNVQNQVVIGLDNLRNSDMEVWYDSVEVETQTIVANRVGTNSNNGVDLDIDGVAGSIGTLDLQVSNGVWLNLEFDAGSPDNLVISGSGQLGLASDSDFDGLQTLDASGYEGDLELDVSGSDVLESIVTGAGDDAVLIGLGAADGDLTVDMGEGDDALGIAQGFNPLDEESLSAIGFAQVSNVQELVFVKEDFFFDEGIVLGDDASLDLSAFDDQLEVVSFISDAGFLGERYDIDGNGNVLSIVDGPETLQINVMGDFGGAGAIGLDTDTIVNLTINADVMAAGFNGSINIDELNGPALENLTLMADGNVTLDVDSDEDHDLSSLVTLDVMAGEDATVSIDADDDDADTDNLTTVSVVAGAAASLMLMGSEGEAAVSQVQEIEFTAAGNGRLILPDGTELTSVGELTAADVAQDFANQINADPSLGYTADVTGGVLELTRIDGGAAEEVETLPDAGNGFVVSSNEITTEGADAIFGEGFAALEDVVVSGAAATVGMADVYGEFALAVEATDGDANVFLSNTGVTAASIAASEDANVGIGTAPGSDITVGAANLTTIDVSAGVNADVEINNAANGESIVVSAGENADLEIDLSNFESVVVNAGVDADVELSNGSIGSVSIMAGEDGDLSMADVSGMESVTVTTGEFADVDFTNVEGAATLDVDAGDGAAAFFENTGFTAITVNAGEGNAYVDLWEGNGDVVTLTVAGDSTNIYLQDDLGSLSVVDVSAIETNVFVTAATGANGVADFDGGSVQYLIGATADVLIRAEDGSTTATREVFNFVGEDIGAVVIDNFQTGDNTDSAADRLDLRGLGVEVGTLVFDTDGGNTTITSATGDFSGEILLLGVSAAEASDLANFNILYA